MPMPATTGQLREHIQEMKKGDYIKAYWTSGNLNAEFLKTTGSYSEYPITGIAWSSNGFFYFVKVGKGLLAADRVIFHTVTWETLNDNRLIEGRQITFDGHIGILRSPTGGVANMDTNGGPSLTNKYLGGWPPHNEWDKYIFRFPTNLIQSGKTIDDVFHLRRTTDNNIPYTWCKETPLDGVISASGYSATNINRVVKVMWSTTTVSHSSATSSGDWAGFRPIFEYKEV